MHTERIKRWKDLVPKTRDGKPSVIYRWLEGDSSAGGLLRILMDAMHYCGGSGCLRSRLSGAEDLAYACR